MDKFSAVMTVRDNQQDIWCKVVLLNIDLYFRGTEEVMYLVAMLNDQEFRAKMKWKIDCLLTANQILNRFGIPQCRLPESSRVPLMKQLGHRWDPHFLSQSDALRMINQTVFSKLTSKSSKRRECQHEHHDSENNKMCCRCREFEGESGRTFGSRNGIEMAVSNYARDTIPTLVFPNALVAICRDYIWIDDRYCRCGHSAADHGIESGEHINPIFEIRADSFKNMVRDYWTRNNLEFVPVIVNKPKVSDLCECYIFLVHLLIMASSL